MIFNLFIKDYFKYIESGKTWSKYYKETSFDSNNIYHIDSEATPTDIKSKKNVVILFKNKNYIPVFYGANSDYDTRYLRMDDNVMSIVVHHLNKQHLWLRLNVKVKIKKIKINK